MSGDNRGSLFMSRHGRRPRNCVARGSRSDHVNVYPKRIDTRLDEIHYEIYDDNIEHFRAGSRLVPKDVVVAKVRQQ